MRVFYKYNVIQGGIVLPCVNEEGKRVSISYATWIWYRTWCMMQIGSFAHFICIMHTSILLGTLWMIMSLYLFRTTRINIWRDHLDDVWYPLRCVASFLVWVCVLDYMNLSIYPLTKNNQILFQLMYYDVISLLSYIILIFVDIKEPFGL